MKHHKVCYRNYWVCSQPSKETWLDVLTCSTTYVAFLLKQHINAFVNVVLSIHRQTIRSVLSPMLVQTTCKVLQRVLVPDILCWLMLFLRFSIYMVAKEFVWDWNNYFLSFNQYLFLFLWFFLVSSSTFSMTFTPHGQANTPCSQISLAIICTRSSLI